jgi:hydrogenase maturation protease
VTAPLLVIGWGNESRGDDALGPLFVHRLRERLDVRWRARVEFLEDYQLQVEHALDLHGRDRVLFVDASLTAAAPFEVTELQSSRDATFTTHALSPQAVMHLFRELNHFDPPPGTLLAIRGERFELGEPPGRAALTNLSRALDWAVRWVEDVALPEGERRAV